MQELEFFKGTVLLKFKKRMMCICRKIGDLTVLLAVEFMLICFSVLEELVILYYDGGICHE